MTIMKLVPLFFFKIMSKSLTGTGSVIEEGLVLIISNNPSKPFLRSCLTKSRIDVLVPLSDLNACKSPVFF